MGKVCMWGKYVYYVGKYVHEGLVKYTYVWKVYRKNWPTNHLQYNWQFMSIQLTVMHTLDYGDFI